MVVARPAAQSRPVAQSWPVVQVAAEAPVGPEHPVHSASPAGFVSWERLSPRTVGYPAGPQAKGAAGLSRTKRSIAHPSPTGLPQRLVGRQRPGRHGLSLEMSLARETRPPNAARKARTRTASKFRRIRTRASRLQHPIIHRFKTLERRGLIAGELAGEPVLGRPRTIERPRASQRHLCTRWEHGLAAMSLKPQHSHR